MKITFKEPMDIKITQSVILLWIIPLIITSLLGILSAYNSSRVQKLTVNLNNNVIPKLVDWSEVDGSIGNLRNTLTKTIDRPFEDDFEKTILDINDQVTKVIATQTELSKNDPVDLVLIANFKKSYDQYYSFIPKIVAIRKENQVPDKQITSIYMGAYGDDLSKNISELVNYQKKVAKMDNDKTVKIFRNSAILNAVVFVLSTIFISVISLFVIQTLKISIEDFTHTLKIIADGDYAVKVKSELTNEFGVMNKALSKFVNSISSVLVETQQNSKQISKEASSMAASLRKLHTDNKSDEILKMADSLEAFGKNAEDISKFVSIIKKN